LTDPVRDAIQSLLDADGDGWVIGPYVTVMGIERVLSDGTVEAFSWYVHPPAQAEWVTAGLLAAAIELRETAEASD
jgi:hypothetical protein